MKIGFTGTQDGMTDLQLKKVQDFVANSLTTDNQAHHGNCIGSDDDFHKIAEIYSYEIFIHPPIKKDKEASGDDRMMAGTMLEAKDYLQRNKDIVDATDILIATPNSSKEKLRSGTWSTIRYAQKQHKPICVFYPDGTFSVWFGEDSGES